MTDEEVRFDPGDFARLVSMRTHSSLVKLIEKAYPELTIAMQNSILVDILGRIASMRGWELRVLHNVEEDNGE